MISLFIGAYQITFLHFLLSRMRIYICVTFSSSFLNSKHMLPHFKPNGIAWKLWITNMTMPILRLNFMEFMFESDKEKIQTNLHTWKTLCALCTRTIFIISDWTKWSSYTVDYYELAKWYYVLSQQQQSWIWSFVEMESFSGSFAVRVHWHELNLIWSKQPTERTNERMNKVDRKRARNQHWFSFLPSFVCWLVLA